MYNYYLQYVAATLVLVVSILLIDGKMIPNNSGAMPFLQFAKDASRLLVFYLHTLFIYKSIVFADQTYEKYSPIIRFYTAFVAIRVLILVFFPLLTVQFPVLLTLSRILIFAISMIIYLALVQKLKDRYLFILFVASSILIVFVMLCFINFIYNSNKSTFMDYIFMTIGLLLENICFIIALIYRVMDFNDQKKIEDEQRQIELLLVQKEMQKYTTEYIGREIHDSLGQKLTLVGFSIQKLGITFKIKELQSEIDKITHTISQTLSELRMLSKILTDENIENVNILKLLKTECKKANDFQICNVVFRSNFKNINFTNQYKIVFVRILQEFLQNSIKHSGCKNCFVNLDISENNIIFMLQDDGKGFDVENVPEGVGIKNIRSRATSIHGDFKLKSDTNKGTKITILIPHQK